jgi:hypothetical protein
VIFLPRRADGMGEAVPAGDTGAAAVGETGAERAELEV